MRAIGLTALNQHIKILEEIPNDYVNQSDPPSPRCTHSARAIRATYEK